PDLTRLSGRIRRDWFDQFLEGPQRFCPGTPMPTVFERGKRATLTSVLDGDALKQRDALWSYFAQGKTAPEPRPVPPVPIETPMAGESALVAQIPIHPPDGGVVESICILTSEHDLLIYDIATGAPRLLLTGAQITRSVLGRLRQFHASAAAPGITVAAEPAIQLVVNGKPELPAERSFRGFDRLPDGVLLRWSLRFPSGPVEIEETIRLIRDGKRVFAREIGLTGLPVAAVVELRQRTLGGAKPTALASVGTAKTRSDDQIVTVT